jgi:hypothetical protein
MLGLRNVLPSPLPPTATRRVAAGREVGRSFRARYLATRREAGVRDFAVFQLPVRECIDAGDERRPACGRQRRLETWELLQ